MENSAYEALYTGVYVIILMIAITVTMFMFKTTYDYSELAFEYNTKVIDESLIVNAPTQKYRLIDGNEVITYFFNYIKRDTFGDSSTPIVYVVTIKNSAGVNIVSTDTSITPTATVKSINYNKIITLIKPTAKYVLTYRTGTSTLIYIDIREATTEEIDATI